ncbi:competence/damage-inducible protein A [Paraflavisolibacter sp. H34]|uniref:competence/damage-inducible protein A n=1 Tax=Huijunlia imazamoxiresistens TaxID=3127457 RepID=UPI00301AE2C0
MTYASILTIGDELLIGQTIDTNSAFIATILNNAGIWVRRRIAVGDDKEEILSALEQQSRDCSLIIITGGLGPTADDITKPALCEYFGSELVLNEDVLEHVTGIFTRLNRPMTERNRKQAEVPHNSTVLPNRNGTAPGMWFEKEGVVYISLPGVPLEMQGLMEEEVIPRLIAHFALKAILHKTLLTAGIGESFIADQLVEFEAALPAHIKLAYLPNYGMVKLRLTGHSDNEETLTKQMEKQFGSLKELVQQWLVTDQDITLQEVVSQMLKGKKKFIATAESCTGGYLAHLFTSLPGASVSYKGGVVSYANDAKENILGVEHATLVKHGAVSEETIKEMVQGVLERLNADYAIATSGIMGPEGGTLQKPVGTVWIAVASRQNLETAKLFFRYDRRRNIELTANAALNMLRKLMVQEGNGL